MFFHTSCSVWYNQTVVNTEEDTMLADLHIHTTFSDGVYTPEQIVTQARAAGMGCIAITDHDNIQAYDRAERMIHFRHLGLKLLRGVEMDTDYKGKDIHVLGYHFNSTNQEFLQALRWNRVNRIGRAEKMVDRIASLGYSITFQEVQEEANGARSLGRPHIARVLVKKGLFPTVQSVFDVLLGAGKPAYYRQVKMSPGEAVALIHQAGGIAVLAHPAEIENPVLVEKILDSVPFDGMEVWHPSVLKENPPCDWLQVAKNHHLFPSGGSDLHGNKGRFPMHLGEFPVQYENVAGIINA
ncbi:PHP domain-containing protein [Acidaminococcus sp.]|uniref:PHP domain-containing protein n=1 Tax=Acidaminococcus sp. TaxID=1872103 RepID=UPI003D7EC0E6